MKKVNLFLLMVVIVFAFGGCNSSSKNQSKKSIKIGVILPLTGDLAFLGNEIKKGIELGIEDINTDSVSLTVVFEDDKSLNPTSSINAANKLITADKVDVCFTMLVEESRPIASVFNKAKVPLLVLWDGNNFIQKSGDYIFSNGFSTERAGELMAAFAHDSLHLKKIAVIKHIDPWAEIITESFKNKYEKLGGQINFIETLQPSEKDYKTIIIKLKKSNSDGVYFPLVPPNSAIFLKQLKESGLNFALLTGDALIQDVITDAGEAAENVYFTNIYSDSSTSNYLKKLYKKKYTKDPIDINLVSFGYEGISKLKLAADKSNKTLLDGFISVFGTNHSADKLEKIYQVKKTIPIELK